MSIFPFAGYGQFGDPVALTSPSTSGTIQYILPSVSTDRLGSWVAAWTAAETSGTLDLANLDAIAIITDPSSIISKGNIITRRSNDNGHTWSAPFSLSTQPSSETVSGFLPNVVTDGAGTWITTWNSNDSLKKTIGADFDILFSRSSNGGTTWSPPAALNTNAAIDTNIDLLPQIAADPVGNWIAVWSTRRSVGFLPDNDIYVSRSTDRGATWSSPQFLKIAMNLDIANDIWPQIACDGAGNWVVVWEAISIDQAQNITMTIKVVRSSNNGGTWSLPINLNRISMPQDAMEIPQLPRLSTDQKGNWIIVWSQDWRIYSSRSTDNGATWSPSLRVDQDPVPLDMDFYNFLPQAAADGLGNWMISWNAADVFAYLGGNLDLDLLMSQSFDGGATWSGPAVLNGDSTYDARIDTWPQLAADPSGNWVALWQGSEGPTSATLVSNIISATAKLKAPPIPTPTPTPLSGVTNARDWTLY